IVGILADGPVEQHDGAANLRKLFQEERLMDKAAGQPIGSDHQHSLKLAPLRGIAQPIQGGMINARATVSCLSIVMLRGNGPALSMCFCVESFDLLVDRLLFGLALGGDPRIDRNLHLIPPCRMTVRLPGSRQEAREASDDFQYLKAIGRAVSSLVLPPAV